MNKFTEQQKKTIAQNIKDGGYEKIEHVVWALEEYAQFRIGKGGFLTAVLENDLFKAFNRADLENGRNLSLICKYIWNYLPGSSWGSPAKVDQWLKGGR